MSRGTRATQEAEAGGPGLHARPQLPEGPPRGTLDPISKNYKWKLEQKIKARDWDAVKMPKK